MGPIHVGKNSKSPETWEQFQDVAFVYMLLFSPLQNFHSLFSKSYSQAEQQDYENKQNSFLLFKPVV